MSNLELPSRPETPSPHPDGLFRIILWTSLCAGAATRAWLAWNDDGLYWPDEIYQSLEPAHRLVFGYGLVAWEFVDGARNWALPGLLAGLLKGLALLGLDHPRQYLMATRLVFCAVGVATAWATGRLAKSAGASPRAAACATALFALSAPFIYFAPRAMGETASALPAAAGLCLALPTGGPRGRRILGASLLGFSVLLRLQLGIFCAGLLLTWALRRRWGPFLEILLTLGLWAFAYGLLDKLTWGDFFHSARVYLQFNLVEGRASQWGVSGTAYYFRVLFRAMPWVSACLILGFFALRRASALFWIAAAFLILHSLIPHKELRFILPVMPLLCALWAVGAEQVPRGIPQPLLLGLGLLSAVASAVGFHQLTFGQLGQYEQTRPQVSAYDDSGPVNRLLLFAHDQADLCGLKIEPVALAWTGGYSYLHRDVPLYPFNGPPRNAGVFNYVVTRSGWELGGAPVARQGPWVLLKLPIAECRKDPNRPWRLP